MKFPNSSWKPLTAEQFLTAVWPNPLLHGETLELRVLERGTPGIVYRSFESSLARLMHRATTEDGKRGNAEIYFGVATRQGRKGDKSHCLRVLVTWVDVDYDWQTLQQKLTGLGKYGPNIIVASGTGFHLYWIFSTALLCRTQQIDNEAINRGLCRHFNGDKGATDITRILRVPGFLNHKYNPARPIRAYRLHDRTFNVEDFRRRGFYMPKPAPVTDVDLRGGKVVTGLPAWLLQKLATVTTDGDPSVDDFSVLCDLLDRGVEPRDAARTFHESKRGKDARVRKEGHYLSYLKTTMGNVVSKVKGKQTAVVDFSSNNKPEADEPLIVFPPSALVGVAADYAHLHAEELEGAVEGFYFSYLTFLGAAVCRHVRLETALPVQPRLYTILLGQSATAKKSSAIDFTDRFFDHVRANSFYTAHGLGSAEGIARLLQDKGLPLLLCFDELKSFVDKTKQEGNVALPMLNTLFEKQKWDNTVKNRKTSVALRDAYMSLLAASTTATYEAMWTASYLDIGFINRLLVIPCARAHKVALPRGISHPALRGLVRKTRDQIAAYVKSSKLFGLDPGARTLWEGWYEALEDTVHARRLDTIGLRLMLLLAVTTGARTITTTLVRQVIAILDYELQMRRLTDPVDAVGNIAKLEEKIRRTLQVHGGLKKRDLGKRIHAARYGTWLFNSALKNLIDDGQVGYDKRSKRYDFGPEGKA